MKKIAISILMIVPLMVNGQILTEENVNNRWEVVSADTNETVFIDINGNNVDIFSVVDNDTTLILNMDYDFDKHNLKNYYFSNDSLSIVLRYNGVEEDIIHVDDKSNRLTVFFSEDYYVRFRGNIFFSKKD